MSMPTSPSYVIAGVTTVADNSDTESESSISDTDSAGSGQSVGNGALVRMGSNASTQSRHNSMQVKPRFGRRLLPHQDDDQQCMTETEVSEANAEIEMSTRTGEANLSKLHIGLKPDFVKILRTNPSLQNLKVLHLSENGITSLPHNLFEHTMNLQKLDLSNNKLSCIPLSVMVLSQLHTLLLDHNQISSIPATFDVAEPFKLPSLTSIGLEWNRLTEFPCHLLQDVAPNLETIYICENLGIKSLPTLDALLPDSPRTKKWTIRLDNRPELMRQFQSGGYASHFDVDWNKIYPDKVMDYVYLGSLRTAQCVEVYRDLDIKFVLTAGRQLDVFLMEGMKQLELQLDDVPGEDIAPFFKQAFDFIDEARAAKKGVLLHCFAGLSRSVTVMVAYLMTQHYPLTRDQALAKVREARPNSQPNEGFMKSLLLYEESLRAARGGQ